jgi:uncharacterized protein (DUF983 family)
MRLECPHCGKPAVTRWQKAVIMFRPTTCRACGGRVGVSMLLGLAYVPSVFVTLVIVGRTLSLDALDAFDIPSLFAVAFAAALVIAVVVELLTPLRPLDQNA